MPIHLKTSCKILSLICIALLGGYSLAKPVLADNGAAIYLLGETQSGRASIGQEENFAPSNLFPCVNCHGAQGQGSKESGIVAPDISWGQLKQSYRKDLNGGYKRTAYNQESFKTALITGVNSDGGKLSDSMPRYQLNDSEITGLIAYLIQVSQQAEQGVEEHAIHFHLRLPRDRGFADAIRQTVLTYASSINKQGGIYGRELVLHERDTESDQAVFGILDLRMESEPAKECELTTLAVFSTRDNCGSEYFLYPHPQQFHHLMVPLVEAQGWTPLVIGHLDINHIISNLQEMTDDQLRSTALIHDRKMQPLTDVITALQALDLYPTIVSDGLYSLPHNESVLTGYPAPLYGLSSPGPESVTTQGRLAYARLAKEGHFSSQYLSARLWSLTLMRLLTTALQQAGKNFTHDLFKQVLQSQVDLQTDFGPLLTYTANRRIGNNSVRLVKWRHPKAGAYN